jgi:hypothetical protein
LPEWLLFVLLFGAPATLTGTVLLRLSNERVEHAPGFPLLENVRVWDPNRYTERGQRLLPWLFGAVLLEITGAALLIWLL